MRAAALHLELVFSRPETTLSVTRGAARLGPRNRGLGFLPEPFQDHAVDR